MGSPGNCLTFQLGILADTLCLTLDLDVGTVDLSLQPRTCHFKAGPSAQLLLNDKLCLFLGLDVGTWDLSF